MDALRYMIKKKVSLLNILFLFFSTDDSFIQFKNILQSINRSIITSSLALLKIMKLIHYGHFRQNEVGPSNSNGPQGHCHYFCWGWELKFDFRKLSAVSFRLSKNVCKIKMQFLQNAPFRTLTISHVCLFVYVLSNNLQYICPYLEHPDVHNYNLTLDVGSKIPIKFDYSATAAGENECSMNVTVHFVTKLAINPNNEWILSTLIFRSVLLGLSQKDCQVLSLDLNLRSNAFGSAGADVLQSFIPNISCITTLDISDNGDYISQCLASYWMVLQYLAFLS